MGFNPKHKRNALLQNLIHQKNNNSKQVVDGCFDKTCWPKELAPRASIILGHRKVWKRMSLPRQQIAYCSLKIQ